VVETHETVNPSRVGDKQTRQPLNTSINLTFSFKGTSFHWPNTSNKIKISKSSQFRINRLN
jgi:hypothetical protein